MRIDRDYSLNTLNIKRKIDGAIVPNNKDEVLKAILSANEEGLKIYPISTGKNWGYGSSLPVSENNIILDLCKLNTISYFDEVDGIITVEPGVTQEQLYQYLKDTDFISPTTGAGPNVSILSNVLERGYGLAPIQDHFSALISLKAFLPDGSEYSSALDEITGEEITKRFSTGIGPSMNGLFTQSNFAIVTEITFKLARKPKHLELAKLTFKNENLERVVATLKKMNQLFPSFLSGMNLMNSHRMESMGIKNPDDWTGVFSVNAHKPIVKFIIKEIRKELKGYAKVQFINFKEINFLKKLPLPLKFKTQLEQAEEMMRLLLGKPTKMALNLCYLKNQTTQKTFDPDKDNCGLIWYSPLIKMDFKNVSRYIEFIFETCEKFNYPPMITLTTLGDMVFDSTIPIVFDKEDEKDTQKAHELYNSLLREGRKLGFYPYRMGVMHMEELTQIAPNFFNIVKTLKSALDPKNTIAPGRYCK